MGKVCYSLSNATVNNCNFMVHTRGNQAVEIRLDLCELDESDIREIFSRRRTTTLIAAYHAALPSEYENAGGALVTAILAGADYVDIDINFPKERREFLTYLAFSRGCRVIISYHDYKGTRPLEILQQVAGAAFSYGADIVKIVTTAVSEDDGERVLRLYDSCPPGRLVAFAMGEKGFDSRLLSFEKGAPFFFVSPTREGTTASGQPTTFDFVAARDILVSGEAVLPSSKSCAQRAILLASLAEGRTKLFGVDMCDDVASAVCVARSLYADVEADGTTLVITGHQDIASRGLEVRDNVLFVGESALLARLCIPLAGLSREPVRICGEKTLLARRIDDHRGVLRRLGLKMTYTDGHYLPVEVGGRLHGRSYIEIKGNKGSQMISGLLIALSQCPVETVLKVIDVTSGPYIDLTSYIASFFGVEIEDDADISEDDSDPSFIIKGGSLIKPVIGMEIERDWSAAAMLMVLSAIAGDVTFRGLDVYSRQADAVIFDVLQHCKVDILKNSDGTVSVRKSIINPFYYDITDSPDLFAPLFVLALRAEGQSVIGGIRRLRNKESDRARTFLGEFRKLGADVCIDGDEMLIWGHEQERLHSAHCSSHGDHRLAMALCVAGCFTDGRIIIDNLECISKSFPGFLGELLRLADNRMKR